MRWTDSWSSVRVRHGNAIPYQKQLLTNAIYDGAKLITPKEVSRFIHSGEIDLAKTNNKSLHLAMPSTSRFVGHMRDKLGTFEMITAM